MHNKQFTFKAGAWPLTILQNTHSVSWFAPLLEVQFKAETPDLSKESIIGRKWEERTATLR